MPFRAARPEGSDRADSDGRDELAGQASKIAGIRRQDGRALAGRKHHDMAVDHVAGRGGSEQGTDDGSLVGIERDDLAATEESS